MSDKTYRGLRDDGRWEEFEASSDEQARPINSGYKAVVSRETGDELV